MICRNVANDLICHFTILTLCAETKSLQTKPVNLFVGLKLASPFAHIKIWASSGVKSIISLGYNPESHFKGSPWMAGLISLPVFLRFRGCSLNFICFDREILDLGMSCGLTLMLIYNFKGTWDEFHVYKV